MIGGRKQVVDRFPVDLQEKFEDHKWGFIADYWTNNYTKFTE